MRRDAGAEVVTGIGDDVIEAAFDRIRQSRLGAGETALGGGTCIGTGGLQFGLDPGMDIVTDGRANRAVLRETITESCVGRTQAAAELLADRIEEPAGAVEDAISERPDSGAGDVIGRGDEPCGERGETTGDS